MKPCFARRERGAVLIVALLFLVMLTLLGVTAMTSTTMEERMAGSARDASVAFQAAEAALRDARRDLNCYPESDCRGGSAKRGLLAEWPVDVTNFGNANFNKPSCGTAGKVGLCLPQGYTGGENAQLPDVPAYTFKGAPTVGYGDMTGVPKLEGVSFQPNYVIELFCLVRHDQGFGSGGNCNFFRVTAVGYGASPLTIVRLQEIVVKEGS